jgi:hypothetical protein
MANILTLPGGINPLPSCGSLFATIDTIEVFVPPNIRSEQYRSFRRFGRFEPCVAKDRLYGHRLIVNRPNLNTVQCLDGLAHECGGVLSRFDICFDIQPPDGVTAEQLIAWIANTAILKWRRRGPMQDYENGNVYWQINHGKRPNRSLLVYHDEVNRVTGELNSVHLELRFFRADTIRRQGIERIKDLIALDPQRLVEKHLKFSDIGQDRVKRMMRQAVKADREQYHQKDTTGFTDQYRATIGVRIKGLLHRLGHDRSQYVKDVFRRRELNAIEPPFVIPNQLTWGTVEVKNGGIEIVGEMKNEGVIWSVNTPRG